MKKRLMMVFASLFLFIGMAMAQTQVKGTVVSDEDGEPVIGASVRVVGTNHGTVTDGNGRFSLTCPQGKNTLSITYVGMEPIEVSARSNMRIVLKNNLTNLDEIMVVAYGTTKKASFTGAASVMKDKDFSAQKTSIVKSLEGKLAGVKIGASTGDPGSDQQVLIRGIGSINGSTQPLYVIDGVPVVNDDMSVSSLRSQSVLSTLNPNDIESMTVLKDAAASSLYGSRAANGVIIITTKKGNAGKTSVNYEMQMGWSEIAKKSAFDMMSASELKQYYQDALQGYFEVYEGLAFNDAAAAAAEEVKDGWFYDYDNNATTDWYKEVYRKGFTTDHQVSINGGGEKTKFYASFGYNKVNGVVKGSSFDRYSGRLNVDHKVNDYLKFSAKQMLSFTSQKGFRDQSNQEQGFGTTAPMSILFSMDPTAPNKLEDGSYNTHASFSAKISNPNLILGQETGTYAETLDAEMMRSMTNVEGELKLPFDLTLRSIFGFDYMHNNTREFWSPNSVNGEALHGLGQRWIYTNKTMTSSTTLNYNKSFGQHNLTALVGFEAEKRNRFYMTANAYSYSTDKLPELANGQASNNSSATYDANMMSWLGSVNYNYANKYYLSASFRRDGSSRLAADNRWANFFSVSGAWRISGEKFLEGNSLFSDLKLRMSYGTNGNLPSDYYGYMGTYATTGSYGSESAIYWSNISNPNLGWEKSYNFNVGLEWTMYNRVTLTVDYYNKLTKDLLFLMPVSNVTGFTQYWNNIGELKNEGLEFSVSSRNIVSKDFTWTTDFNLTKQTIKVNKLPNGDDVQYGDGNMYLLREGESMHTFYLPQAKGVNPETGLMEFWIDPEDHDKGVTEYYSKAGSTIVGKGVPDWIGGITNTFRYKDFDLSFMISYQFGADMFDYPGYFLKYSDGVRVGSFNMQKAVAGNYWQKPGDVCEFPRPIYGNPYRSDRFSSREIISTDNIRVRDITVGWNIPYFKKYLSNLRVYFRATNPFLIYNAADDLDPDVDINGYRQTDTPALRQYTFGLNLTF
ncbi:MAG: TonB-dependent receptor [Prevotella sp.]|nr:TonB-dependent receptor [Prevotella sp.]